jgi:LysM repeat protein
MALTIPPKPSQFSPSIPPPGFRKLYVNFAGERKRIVPRVQLIHTNGAKTAGSIESSKNWAERRTVGAQATTLPTFQVDLDGDAAQFIDSNQAQNACYKANPFAISYETADSGWASDPTISAFTGAQLQMLANGVAYCSVLYGITLAYPTRWDGNGTASHTEPFGYPYWTNSSGKICPGQKKKAQVRDIIIPHAKAIVNAWSGKDPIPPPGSGGGKYTVQAGDSWWKISQMYGITVDQLVAMNPPATSATVIHPGQVLNVPGGSTTPTPPPVPKAPNGLTAEQNRIEGNKAASPPASPVIKNTLIHNNCPWLQQVLCAMNTLPADGGGPIFPPDWVGEGRIGSGTATFQMFGDGGKSALAYWQSKNGLTADGIYGSQTYSKMRAVRGK